MRVFISWSGNRSKKIALALRSWLQRVVPGAGVEFWMSERDLPPGAPWPIELLGKLAESSFCIACVTATNQNAPWLLFEAGVVAGWENSPKRVCPLVFDLSLPLPGPLGLFQAKAVNRQEDMLSLVKEIVGITGEPADDALVDRFEHSWEALEAELAKLPSEAAPLHGLLDETSMPLRLAHSQLPGNALQVGDLAAVATIVGLVQRYGSKFVRRQFRVRPAPAFGDGELRDQNLVLVGGPRSNCLTKLLMSQHESPVSYDMSRHSYTFDEREFRNSGMDAYDTFFQDHGLLMRLPSPWNPSLDVVVIAGLSDRSAEAIGDMIQNDSSALNPYVQSRHFVCIVRSEHRNGVLYDAQLLCGRDL